MKIYILVLIVLLFSIVQCWAIGPSQVLVLYNEDFREDNPLTEPGQDSKEIAEHYIQMHTDSETGEKPYILGLSCTHNANHLNDHYLNEISSDNQSGVKLQSLKRQLSTTNNMRDGRLVEFTLPKSSSAWDLNTFDIVLDSAKEKFNQNLTLISKGENKFPEEVSFQKEGKWNVRFNGSKFREGSFTVIASLKDIAGKKHSWSADFKDIRDVICTRTGPDGIRDDRNFFEDVELPVKKFLEDPNNARPDGTLLKDYIFYIVVSYGLPRTARATYGIARGITDKINNFGSDIAFEQRLQLLYYDLEKIMGFNPHPQPFQIDDPFHAYYFRAPQAWPLFGEKANPFVHPLLYRKEKRSLDNLPEPLSFNTANRNSDSDRHLYFVMRIDGENPMQASGLIDRAVYASKYGGMKMGAGVVAGYPIEDKRYGRLNQSKLGRWLWGKGFYHLYHGGAAMDRLAFLRFLPTNDFFNRDPVYLPGGIAGTVISHNGWKKGEMVRDIAMGVTITAGAARVYNGAPHIHSESWWDDEILYPFFIKGKTIGENLLMNQPHLGWITTFIGDPLYRWPLSEFNDTVMPEFDKNKDVYIVTKKGANSAQEVWLRLKLHSSSKSPETAQLRAISSGGRTAVCDSFEATPYVYLGTKEEVFNQKWRIEVKDPYGNNHITDIEL